MGVHGEGEGVVGVGNVGVVLVDGRRVMIVVVVVVVITVVVIVWVSPRGLREGAAAEAELDERL